MQKYSNNIQDQFGNELTGATITVRLHTGGALASIFSDDGVTPKANPFVAASSEFSFYGANDRYDIFITGTVIDEELDVLLFDDVGVVGVQGLPSVLAIDPLTILDAEFSAGASIIFSNAAVNANFSQGATDFISVFTGVTDWDLTGLTNFRMAGGAIALLEIASAPGDVANYGQFWVRTSDGNAMFTNDVGTDFVMNVPGTFQGVLDAGPTSTTDAQFITGAGIDLFSPDDVDDVHIAVIEPGAFPYLSFISTVNVEEYRFDKDINIPGLDFFLGTGRLGFYNRGDSVDNHIENNGGELEITVVGDPLRVNATSIRLAEQAASGSDVANWGQYWVRSSGPNRPTFTDDVGTDQLLDPSLSEIISVVASRVGILTDKGKTVAFTGATAAQTMTIPANGSVAYPIGTLLAWDNSGSVAISIAITTDTLRFAKDNTTGTRTLAAGGFACALKVGATSWKIAGSALLT